MIAVTIDLFAICLLLVLAVLMPAIGVWEYRRFLRRVHEGRPGARLKTYAWTIALQWTLTIVFLGWWLASGQGLASIRLVPTAGGLQWLVVGAGLAILAAVVIQAVTVLRSTEKLADTRQQVGELGSIAPRSPAESRLFAILCLTAGVCEEILYRGLLMAVLAAAVGLWPAVVLSALIFGLGHAYQGGMGIVRTAGVGLVMALLAVGTGSLFVPILLHAVIDLTSGRMLSEAMRGASPVHGP